MSQDAVNLCPTCGLPVAGARLDDPLRCDHNAATAGVFACASASCGHVLCTVARSADAARIPITRMTLAEIDQCVGMLPGIRDLLALAACRMVRDGAAPEAIVEYVRGLTKAAAAYRARATDNELLRASRGCRAWDT